MMHEYLANVEHEIHTLMGKPLTSERVHLMCSLLKVKKILCEWKEHDYDDEREDSMLPGDSEDLTRSRPMGMPMSMLGKPMVAGKKSYFGGN